MAAIARIEDIALNLKFSGSCPKTWTSAAAPLTMERRISLIERENKVIFSKDFRKNNILKIYSKT